MNNIQHPGRPAPVTAQPQMQPQADAQGLGSIFSPNPKLMAAKQQAASEGLGSIGIAPQAGNDVARLAGDIQAGNVGKDVLAQLDPALVSSAFQLLDSASQR